MFREIKNIDEILRSVEDRKDFVVGERDGYTVIDYVVCFPDSFDDELRLECRGIKFKPNGEILSRPFHKFFNLGEREQIHEIDWSKDYSVEMKLDGSMVHAAIVDSELVLMTRMGVTDVALQAMKEAMTDQIKDLCWRWCNGGITPIFEYTSPNNRIVVPYKEPKLTLLSARFNGSGKYIPHHMLAETCHDYRVPLVRKRTFRDIDDLHGTAKGLKDEEGYVIVFSSGHRLKIKADEYLLHHRALSDFGSPKKVLNIILEGLEDDFRPLLRTEDREKFDDYAEDIKSYMITDSGMIDTLVEKWKIKGLSRKEIALNEIPNLDKAFRSMAFSALDGKNTMELIKSVYRTHPSLVPEWKWKTFGSVEDE